MRGSTIHFAHSDAGLLSRTEERELIARAQAGDLAARNRLVEANMGLIGKVATRYRAMVIDQCDLINEGSFGLMAAIRKFDLARPTRFSTYAIWWIRCVLNRYVASHCGEIRVPAHLVPLLKIPADELPPLAAKQRRMLREAKRARCIFRPAAELLNLVQAGEEDAPDLDDGRQRVRAMLGELGERSRLILTLRYGLDGGEPRTLSEVGEMLGLSKERIRQIQQQAVKAIREQFTRGKSR